MNVMNNKRILSIFLFLISFSVFSQEIIKEKEPEKKTAMGFQPTNFNCLKVKVVITIKIAKGTKKFLLHSEILIRSTFKSKT